MRKKIHKRQGSVNLRRWASYAAAATALAAASEADAGTIYYSGALNVTVNKSHDFNMSVLSHGHGAMAFPGYYKIASFFAGSNGGLGNDVLEKFGSNQPNALNAHFVGIQNKGPNTTYQLPSRLATGVKISAQHFTNKFGRASAILALHTYPLAGSKWSSAGTGFLGFEIKNEGTAEQYGWARITTTSSGTSYTIVDYAIGSPGQPITAGETTTGPAGPVTAVWTGAADNTWVNSANWNGGVVPGATSGTSDPSTALFNQAVTNQPTVIDANRDLMNITFDTASCPSITIGATTGNPLLLTQGGTIQLTSTVVTAQTINAPLILEGAAGAQTNTYTLSNNSTTTGATLTVAGTISSAATQGVTTLVLSGTNSGANTISGSISDGGAGSQVALSVLGGNWILAGADTFSGGTIIASGATLNLSGSTPSFNSGNMNIVGAGSLVVNSSQQVGTITGSGNVAVNGGSLTAYQIRQNSLTIGSGATVTLRPSGSGSTTNPAGPNNINFSSSVTSLSIAGTMNAWTGTLDIGNNGLVIAYGTLANDPYATINNMVESGYNGGVWGGTGITSTLAQAGVAQHISTPLNIGLLDFTPGTGNYSNTTFIVFEGQTVTTNAILVRLTYMDDLVLAGDMASNNATSDALLFAANYGTGTTWGVGDLVHNGGPIDSSDALLFAANYVVGLPSLDGSTGGDVTLGSDVAAVPEPASLGLLAIGAIGLLAIRRSRKRKPLAAPDCTATLQTFVPDLDSGAILPLAAYVGGE